MFKGRKPISKEMILSIVSEEELFKKYCESFEKVDSPFCSELRMDSKFLRDNIKSDWFFQNSDIESV